MKKLLSLLLALTAFAQPALASLPPTTAELAYVRQKNLLKNPGAEQGKAYWSLGHVSLDATTKFPSGAPTFGSGASVNLSLGVSNTSPLSGAYSFTYASSVASTAGDMVCSDAVSLTSEYQASVLAFRFSYSVSSGSANVTLSGTTSNSFGVAVYDVTNSAWIQPAGVFNLVQLSGTGISTGTFQTGSSTASIRLCVYNANATAGAATLKLDSFYTGHQISVAGAAASDWVSFTPSITNLPTSSVAGKYRRVGDTVDVQIYATASGAATGTISAAFPSGIAIDTSKYAGSFQPLGIAWGQISSTNYTGTVVLNSGGSSVQILGPNNNSAWNATIPATWANGSLLTLEFFAPVSGWSSNTTLSSDTDTRVVAAAYTANTTQAATSSAILTLFGTKVVDTHSAYNSGTGVFTCPITGNYRVTFSTYLSSGSYNAVQIRKNSSAVYVVNPPTLTAQGSGVVPCNTGETLDLYNLASGAGTYASGNTAWVAFERLSGPATIAATETAAAEYNTNVALTITNITPTFVDFATKETDTHGAVLGAGGGVTTTAGTGWRYVCPASGRYQVDGFVTFSSLGSAAFDMYGAIYVNSTEKIRGRWGTNSTLTMTTNVGIGAHGVVRCVTGDTIQFAVYQSTGVSHTLDTIASANRISIVRVGNY